MTRDDYEILQEWLDRKAKNNPYARTAAFKYETGYKEGIQAAKSILSDYFKRQGKNG